MSGAKPWDWGSSWPSTPPWRRKKLLVTASFVALQVEARTTILAFSKLEFVDGRRLSLLKCWKGEGYLGRAVDRERLCRTQVGGKLFLSHLILTLCLHPLACAQDLSLKTDLPEVVFNIYLIVGCVNVHHKLTASSNSLSFLVSTFNTKVGHD